MKITLHSGPHGTYIIRAENGREILIQSDMDYPAIAADFGARIDLVNWPLQRQIAHAVEFLDEHEDETIEDPGYFELIEGG